MISQTLYTACVTPFKTVSAKIDYESLEKLLRMQEDAGNGVLLFGSTGEALSLSLSEKIAILNFVSKLNLNTQVMLGVPNHNLESALEFIEIANSYNIQGYLMATPIYTKPGIIGQTKWFERLLDSSSFDVMLYNIPGRAAVKLYTQTVANLSNHPKFKAIKDCSGNLDSMMDYKSAAPNIALYCGDDALMPSMAAYGAIGLISIASNAWPKQIRQYSLDALNRCNTNQTMWWKACNELFAASNPIPIKALLKEIGIINSKALRLPLSEEDFNSISELLSHHRLIQTL